MGKRKTVAQQTQEATFSRMIARTFEHRQTLLLMHALEQYARMIDLMDARFPSAEARGEAKAALDLLERVKVAHSIRQWLETDDAEDGEQSSTQPSENDRSPRWKVVTTAWIVGCPIKSLSAAHYRQDGSCRCGEEAAS